MFQEFPKIPRWNREVTITEKIDGTNAQIIITEEGEVRAGSRTRLITQADDNFGFAKWVYQNEEELKQLGPGNHFGEWWGQGIQRTYSLPEKRFSLFNTKRWTEGRPACCGVVPTLYEGVLEDFTVTKVASLLKRNGSVANPGFMNPEGIVIWHSTLRQYAKFIFDDSGKGKNENMGN